MSFLLCCIPFFIFLIPFSKAVKLKNKPAMVICGLYLLSAFSSFFMDKDSLPFHDFDNDSAFIFLLYSILLLPFLILSLKIKPFRNPESLPVGKVFNVMIFVFSIGAVYSIIYLIPYAITSLALNASDIRSVISEDSILPPTFFTTIAVGFPTFYFVYSFMFFCSIVQKRSTSVIVSMFLGLLSFAVNVFTVAGRDGVLFSGLAFVLGFFMFQPMLTQKQSKIFKIGFISVGVFALSVIFKITAQRFSESDGIDLQSFKSGIVGYLGMQPFIFSEWINNNQIFNHGTSSFQFFLDILGIGNEQVYEYTEQYTWMFGTFLVTFFAVNGFSSLFALTALFYTYFRVNIRVLLKEHILSSFFFLSFYLHFILSGVFYFRLQNRNGNLFILISVIFIYLFKKRVFRERVE